MVKVVNPFVVTGKIEPEIVEGCYTFLSIFFIRRVCILGKEIYETLLSRSRKIIGLFVRT